MYSKRFLWFFFVLILLSSTSHSYPDWVKQVTQVKDYPVSEEAGILILEKSTKIKYKDNGQVEILERIAMKVLNAESANNTYLNEPINEYRKIKNLEGWQITSSGEENKLEKENIFEIGLFNTSGYYSEEKILLAMFGNINKNDIIAYEYKIEEKSAWFSYFQKCIFQVQDPVRHVTLEVELPKNWGLHYSAKNMDDITYTVENQNHIWTGIDLKYRGYEPYMPPWKYVSKYIEVSCYNPNETKELEFDDWASVSYWCNSIMEPPSMPDDAIKQKVMEITNDKQTLIEKISAIAEYIQNNIRYVAVEIGKERFAPRDAHKTYYNKYGDCKDKTTLMRSMLKVLEVPSYPVLATTDNYIDKNHPSPFQFNHCIIAIPNKYVDNDSARMYSLTNDLCFFDPTSESVPFGQLPLSLYGSKVLPIGDSLDIINLKYPMAEKRKIDYNADLELTDNFSLKGTVRINYQGLWASEVEYMFKTSEDKDIKDYFKSYFVDYMTNIVIDNFSFEADQDSCWINFALSGDNILSEAGSLKLLKVNIFHSDRQNSFKSKIRNLPIWYENTELSTTRLNWKIPQFLKFEEGCLKSLESECDIASINFNPIIEENSLSLELIEKYVALSLDKEKYLDIKNFDNDRAYIHNVRAVLLEE